MLPGDLTPAALHEAFERHYARIKGTRRCLTPTDRLSEDLDLTSVDCLDIVALLDDELGLESFDRLVNEGAALVTVGDILDALGQVA